MKKSIICIIIVLTIVLTGCVENQASSQNDVKETYLSRAQKYGYLSMLGVTWGMDFEECVQAMGLKEKDFKKVEKDNINYKEILYITNLKIIGKDSEFVLSFDEKDNDIFLTKIRIGFEEEVPLDFFKEEFEKYVKEQNLSFEEYIDETDILGRRYYNKAKVDNLKDDKIKIRVNELLNTTYPQYNKISNYEMYGNSLNHVLILLGENNNVLYVLINGEYASLVDYADKEIYGETSSDE